MKTVLQSQQSDWGGAGRLSLMPGISVDSRFLKTASILPPWLGCGFSRIPATPKLSGKGPDWSQLGSFDFTITAHPGWKRKP
jgi:hypothetical protein